MPDYEIFEAPASSDTLRLDAINTSPDLPVIENAYLGESKDELKRKILEKTKWRFDHGLDELKTRDDTYHAYTRRVLAMMDMTTVAIEHLGFDLTGRTVADLASAEGFFAFHARQAWRTGPVDAFELNLDQIDRAHLVQAYKEIDGVTFRRTDFENAGWARGLDKTYEVVLCLGIIYHIQNPMLFLRNVRKITNGLLVLESDTPVTSGRRAATEAGRIILQRGQVTLEPGNIRELVEFRPDRTALISMLHAVGFSRVIVLPPSKKIDDPYFKNGRKSMMLAFN